MSRVLDALRGPHPARDVRSAQRAASPRHTAVLRTLSGGTPPRRRGRRILTAALGLAGVLGLALLYLALE